MNQNHFKGSPTYVTPGVTYPIPQWLSFRDPLAGCTSAVPGYLPKALKHGNWPTMTKPSLQLAASGSLNRSLELRMGLVALTSLSWLESLDPVAVSFPHVTTNHSQTFVIEVN